MRKRKGNHWLHTVTSDTSKTLGDQLCSMSAERPIHITVNLDLVKVAYIVNNECPSKCPVSALARQPRVRPSE